MQKVLSGLDESFYNYLYIKSIDIYGRSNPHNGSVFHVLLLNPHQLMFSQEGLICFII